jgi:hypothetical protein
VLDANRRTEQLVDGLLVPARSDRVLADRVPLTQGAVGAARRVELLMHPHHRRG